MYMCVLCSVGVWAEKVCGMDCSGRLGVPPSLYCDMCMALFHPECVGFSYLGRHVGFLCQVPYRLTAFTTSLLLIDLGIKFNISYPYTVWALDQQKLESQ